MSLRAPALALCSLFACSGPADPAPLPAAPVAAKTVTPPATQANDVKANDAKQNDAKQNDAKQNDGKVSLLPAINSPAPAPEPPLTQEELDLLAADPTTLTPELRRKRAFAMRRKILQNPDSPTARQLEALRLAYERGELQPQLPDKKPADGGLVLQARPTDPKTTDPKTTDPKTTDPKTTKLP